MTIHLCRDFLTDTTASCPGTNMYALGMFLTHVGGFNVIGQTNFDLEVTASTGQGISGTINMGFGSYEVNLPTASYSVSTQDVGRILALKSQLYPLANSGLFRVTGVDIPNNGLVIDYRAASTPPPEQYLAWRVFINEAVFGQYWKSGSNGTGNYGSFNPNTSSISNASRVVLRSLDKSSWEVRMCLESSHDSGSVPSRFSIAPGFGGDGDGDFGSLDSGVSIGKRIFTHAALWYDTTSSIYQGMTVGLTPAFNVNGQWRISMIMDDVSGTCGIVNRNVTLPHPITSGSGWCVFGLAEDETEIPADANLSDPGITGQRLFVVGSSTPTSKLTWQTQFHADNVTQVVGWSKLGYPVAGVLSLYSDISNPSNSHVRYITSSADNVWNNKTELFDAEILLGTIDVTQAASNTTPLFPLQPRRLGRLPLFRQGRANFNPWTVTGDDNWYHTEDGIFMPWGGPIPTDATQMGTNPAMVSSASIELQQGLDPLGAFLPGSDPPSPEFPPNILDVDATRFRKTYSYFRQVPVNVGVQKGGSNPAKP